MPPIRVLIVDDSVVIRRVLSDGLGSDPGLQVVGTAADGKIALSKLSQLAPDIITLDVEMPTMNGLETLAAIRKTHPRLPVIMFSTLTESGAATTLDALALGASDYATKPSNSGNLDGTIAQIRQQLIPKIKALCAKRNSEQASQSKIQQVTRAAVSIQHKDEEIELLAIGTSTGGPNALGELIPRIPAEFPVPIVIVQHMPRVFTRLLANRLNDNSAITVQEGKAGAVLKPGEAWIAPGDYHMTVERHGAGFRLATNQDPPENSCRPAVDPLFRSVAKAVGPHALAVVLTGMGSDGVVGAQHIRERGGTVFIQDEASSVVWGMPGQVAAANLEDATYSLSAMANEIVRRVKRKMARDSGIRSSLPAEQSKAS